MRTFERSERVKSGAINRESEDEYQQPDESPKTNIDRRRREFENEGK